MIIKIHNKRIRADECKGIHAAIGFMFCLSQKRAKILSFLTDRIIPLHMFFVFFPLQIVFVNSKFEVVDEKILNPFTFYTSPKKAKYVVELPLQLKIKVKSGDKIKFLS